MTDYEGITVVCLTVSVSSNISVKLIIIFVVRLEEGQQVIGAFFLWCLVVTISVPRMRYASPRYRGDCL